MKANPNKCQPNLPPLSARNDSQLQLIRAIKSSPVTIAVGPAGTGKTYIAVRMAAQMLAKGDISRIILTRPAVGAGERLGHLPGDILEKMDPFLYEMTRVLQQCFPNGVYGNLLKEEMIEIVPFEYMRSRTWDDAFIICDEAQNTTSSQMKMFTTRLGERSKVVICGDIFQSDLRGQEPSGLEDLLFMGEQGLFSNVSCVGFTEKDVVRSAICAEFVQAWNNLDAIFSAEGHFEIELNEEESMHQGDNVYELKQVTPTIH